MAEPAPLEERVNTVSAMFATPEEALAAVDRLRGLGITNIRDAVEDGGVVITMNAGPFEQQAWTIVAEHGGRMRGKPG